MSEVFPPHIKNLKGFFGEFYRWVWNKTHWSDDNVTLCFVGKTGSGKSAAASRTGYDLDWNSPKPFFPRFDASHTIWKAEDFMGFIEGKTHDGNAVQWEEIGTSIRGANARQWYSERNQLLSSVVQTFRKKHLVTLFTVPSFRFIDSQIRDCVDAVISMQGVDRRRKLSRGKFYWSSFHFFSGKPIFARPRYYENGLKVVLDRVYFRLPPKSFLEEYEEKKEREDKQMNKIIVKQLDLMKNKILELASKGTGGTIEEEKMDLKKVYSDIVNRLHSLIIDINKPLIDATRLEIEFEGIGQSRASRIATLINREIKAGKYNELLGLKKSKGSDELEDS